MLGVLHVKSKKQVLESKVIEAKILGKVQEFGPWQSDSLPSTRIGMFKEIAHPNIHRYDPCMMHGMQHDTY